MNEIQKKRIEEAADDLLLHEMPSYYEAFVKGAEYALSHQWISIEEALPKDEFDGFMNVYIEMDTGHGIEHCVLFATYYSGKFSCETKHVKVIAWMPIPKFETKKE